MNYVKFRESSIIVKIFTEDFGLQSYIVNGVRSSKGRGKIALFQPLTLLELVVYKNDQKSIQRISETKCERPFNSIPINVKKSTIALFWAELLSKTIKNEGLEDREKFAFIRNQLITLDDADSDLESFPISFCIEFAKYLGFEIESGLNLVSDYGYGNLTQEGELVAYLEAIINHKAVPKTSRALRTRALVCLLSYYEIHLEDFKKMKSIEVLKQLFS